jgi:1,4-dihydroxy-2-naphthoate octaprenyltransferase
LWLVNALYFGGTVFYIKLKVRQQPRLPAPDRLGERLLKSRACLTYQGVVLTVIIALVALDHVPALLPLAFVPMTLKVIYGAARWQDKHSLSLPRLGVIEVIHSTLFAVLVIAAF